MAQGGQGRKGGLSLDMRANTDSIKTIIDNKNRDMRECISTFKFNAVTMEREVMGSMEHSKFVLTD